MHGRSAGTRLPLMAALVLLIVTAAPAAAHSLPPAGPGPAVLPGHAEGDTLPTRIDLPAGWQPEGITAGRGSTVYVGSLANGAIYQADVRTGKGFVLVPGVSGRVAVGVDYDRRDDRLWVAGGATGTVRVYAAKDGALLQTYQFADPGFLNDLVVTGRAVYVTDSSRRQLDVVPLGADGALPAASAATTLPLTGAFQVVPNAINLNGIVAMGRTLVSVSTVSGILYAIDPATGATAAVDVTGGPLLNGDGLELVGRTLFVSRNQDDLIVAVRFTGRNRARVVHTTTSSELVVPSTIAFQAGFLWAVNARFNTTPTPTTPYWVTRLPAFGQRSRIE